MARKQGKVKAEIVNKGTLEFLRTQGLREAEFELGSAELRTWQHYLEVCQDEAEAEARLDLIYEPLADRDDLPPEARTKLNDALNDLAVQQRRAISALASHEMVLKNTFSVPDADAKQIILDALQANTDAMPDEYAQLTGLQRYAEYVKVADDLIGDLKSKRVKVRENDELEAPYCDDCEAELAA